MTKQEQIAQFLDQRITFPRVMSVYGWAAHQQYAPAHLHPYQRPTAEQLANELLAIPEFRALQLGTWLNTTQGEVIAEAVEMVAPPFYRQDVELLVEGLKLAAHLQAQEGQQKAGKVALGVVGAAALIALGIWGEGTAAA